MRAVEPLEQKVQNLQNWPSLLALMPVPVTLPTCPYSHLPSASLILFLLWGSSLTMVVYLPGPSQSHSKVPFKSGDPEEPTDPRTLDLLPQAPKHRSHKLSWPHLRSSIAIGTSEPLGPGSLHAVSGLCPCCPPCITSQLSTGPGGDTGLPVYPEPFWFFGGGCCLWLLTGPPRMRVISSPHTSINSLSSSPSCSLPTLGTHGS